MPIAKNRLGISEIGQKKSRGHSSGPAKVRYQIAQSWWVWNPAISPRDPTMADP
jgi:hypothetical protein